MSLPALQFMQDGVAHFLQILRDAIAINIFAL